MLLSFLKIRVVINGKDIYPLVDSRPIVIDVPDNNPKVVITDGYHHTTPVELVFHHLNTYYFHVICTIDDVQMFFGFVFILLFFLLGIGTGFIFFKLISFIPLLYFLYVFYINRKEFIQLKAV